jgi:arsenate reductase-like glutaredoxin family protein
LLRRGAALIERDLGRDPLSEKELAELFGERDPRDFLNPRNQLYRKLNMKDRPPTAAQTLRLMAREPNLIRRPIVARGRDRVVGYDEVGLLRILR